MKNLNKIYSTFLLVTILLVSCFWLLSSCTITRGGLVAPPPESEPVPDQEVFEFVSFPNDQQISAATDSRLNYGSAGTIEILFRTAIPKTKLVTYIDKRYPDAIAKADAAPDQVLLAQGQGGLNRFIVFINRKQNRIGIHNGTNFASLPYDFQDRDWHHVALSTDNGQTAIICDGKEIGKVEVGYSSVDNVPLHVGSLDGANYPFRGDIFSIRLWSQPLTADQVSKNKFYGNIPLNEPYVKSLVLYSFFTNKQRRLLYTHEPLQWLGNVNLSEGAVDSWVMPYGFQPKHCMVRVYEDHIHSIGLAYQGFVGDSAITMQNWFPYGSASFQEGETAIFPLIFPLEESITGISGTYTPGEGIKSIRFVTDYRVSPIYESSETGLLPFHFTIPTGYRFGGFSGQHTEDGSALLAVGLGCKRDSSLDDQDLGVFAHELAGEPIRNDSFVQTSFIDHKDKYGNIHLHGNYNSFPLFHIKSRYISGKKVIWVEGEFPSNGFRPQPPTKEEIDFLTAEFKRRADIRTNPSFLNPVGLVIDSLIRKQVAQTFTRNVFQAANTFGPEVFSDQGNSRFVHHNGSVFTQLDAETFHLESVEGFPMRSGIYELAKGYQQGDEEKKDPWGATFTIDQRPRMLDFNFRGYNIAKLSHDNYQLGTGTSKYVFKLPDDASRDYQYTSNGLILPYGIIFKNDREAMLRAKSVEIDSEQKHQQAWNMNLGLNIGIPGMSFGASVSHQESIQRMSSTKKKNALSMAFEVKHALVLDKARMQLHPDFRAGVELLRDTYLSYGEAAFAFDSLQNDPYGVFIQKYGSHYPYAVSYGGMAYQEVALDAKTTGTVISKGTNIKASASGTFEGNSLGIQGGGGNSTTDEVKDAITNQITRTKSIGGSLSLGSEGGSWSLPDHSEVPVLLDLRPIYELLSPIYFDDPVIWNNVRNGLKANLEAQGSTYQWDRRSWNTEPTPKAFTVELHYLENISAGDGLTDYISEYFGSITVNGESAWCVNKGNSGDFTCPWPKPLPNVLVAGVVGKPINRMPFKYTKTFYVTKEEYCEGNLEIVLDIDEDDGPGDTDMDDWPTKTITHPWLQFRSSPQTFKYHFNDGIPPTGTQYNIYYSLISDAHNWQCPSN